MEVFEALGILLVVAAATAFVGVIALTVLAWKTDADDASGRRAPSPSSPVEPSDLSWKRSGKRIVGTYRDFELVVSGHSEEGGRYFHATYYVRRGGAYLKVAAHADTYDRAIAAGLDVIRERVRLDRRDERRAEECFAALTAAPAPAARVAVLPAHGPEVRRRYLA